MEDMIEMEEQQVEMSIDSRAVQSLPGFALPAGAPLSKRLAMARIVAKFIGASTPMDECFGREVSIVGVMIHPVRLTDMATGAVVFKTRTVWLCGDGSCLSSVSDVTRQFTEMALLPFFAEGQQGLFDAPVPVRIRPQKTRAGRKTFSFEIVE